ncbi:MAG: DUF5060 domain-containing protein [Treponema sp.]|jgi:hypothetical protein|nr:DUF5060 domain-containing protein [Treponema sp.]
MKVWEVQEITLSASGDYKNPYMDADVWIDLKGPGFEKRVYGFWDGDQIFKIRFTATAPGEWTYRSGSFPENPGLAGKSGCLTALPASEEDKERSAAYRGILRPSENGRGFVHPEGTNFFMIGDTWWAAPSFRFKWSAHAAFRRPGAGGKKFYFLPRRPLPRSDTRQRTGDAQ